MSIADGAFYLERLGAGSLFTVLPNGSVGIGTNTPNRLLHVQGTEIHSGGAVGGLSFGNRETANFVNIPSAGERWVWYSTGGIARLWSGGDKVSVDTAGVVRATQFVSSSSRELKENIAEISTLEAIETLKNLNPVKFNYKTDSEKNQYMGFVAEDVPELVATSDRKGINAMDMIAVLTKALQEQQNTIAVLAEKIQSLEVAMS
ncbi:MAG: tail fiber domain-containing protein [Calothrix sp. SM1_7_51]|nr:tail fiber domain-containing protein [Calothrix sp. SM1_7_51]